MSRDEIRELVIKVAKEILVRRWDGPMHQRFDQYTLKRDRCGIQGELMRIRLWVKGYSENITLIQPSPEKVHRAEEKVMVFTMHNGVKRTGQVRKETDGLHLVWFEAA